MRPLHAGHRNPKTTRERAHYAPGIRWKRHFRAAARAPWPWPAAACPAPGCRDPPAPSALQPANETLHPLEALLDVLEAGGVADANVVVRAEREAGHRGHLLRLEQAAAELDTLQARPADVREEVEGALAVHAGDSGHRVEPLPGGLPAARILGEPHGKMILRPGQCLHAPLLREARRVARAV